MPVELPRLPDELPDGLRYEAVPHRPDGVVPPRGLLSLAVLALAVGPGFGWLVQRLSVLCCFNPFSATTAAVLFLGPLLVQFGTSAVRWGQVRRPALAGAVAVLLLGTMALGHLFGRYQAHRAERARDLVAQNEKLREQRKPLINVQEELDRESFDEYLAEEHGWELLYLLIPVALVGRHAARTLAQAAARPFCPLCGDWKRPHLAGTLTVQGTREELRRLAADGELVRLTTWTKAVVPEGDEANWVLVPPDTRRLDPEAPKGVLVVHTCPCRGPEA